MDGFSRPGKRTGAGAALGVAIVLATPAAAQATEVYRCRDASGATVYSQQPCAADAQPQQIRWTGASSEAPSRELHLQGTSCRVDYGYGRANGYIVNTTNEPKRATLMATFLRNGVVVDTVRDAYSVPARGRTPFSVMSAPESPTRCEYQIRWD